MARIGLYFGSFNPIHKGHLKVAEMALENDFKSLDKVWFIPSPQNPFKNSEDLLSYDERVKMIELSIGGKKNIEVNIIEKEINPPNYTFDTLELLKTKYPNDTFLIILGSDNVLKIDQWKNYKDIVKHFEFIIISRDGFKNTSLLFDFNMNYCLLSDSPNISSTEIREKIYKNESIISLVTKEVSSYIINKKLYTK